MSCATCRRCLSLIDSAERLVRALERGSELLRLEIAIDGWLEQKSAADACAYSAREKKTPRG